MVKRADGQVQENHYDSEGLRHEMKENGKLLRFCYHRGELLQKTGEDSQTSYTLGAGIEGFQRGHETYYYHQDEQLSTALLTNHLGEVQNHYQYDAFGDTLEKVEGIHNRIQYTNQQYDMVTGQYYLRARYYNPILGRFLQEDVYQGDGQNLYAYCGNNPVMYYDPSGYAKEYNGGWDEIPSAENGFNDWYNSMNSKDFDAIWADKDLRKYIEVQIRQPGKYHEWLMAGRADTFKYWGQTMDEIKLDRSLISETDFINPSGQHGKVGSTTAHNEIRDIIDTSLNHEDYTRRLRTWADYRLPEVEIGGVRYPGSARLPGNLKNQEAIDYINRLNGEQGENEIKSNKC